MYYAIQFSRRLTSTRIGLCHIHCSRLQKRAKCIRNQKCCTDLYSSLRRTRKGSDNQTWQYMMYYTHVLLLFDHFSFAYSNMCERNYMCLDTKPQRHIVFICKTFKSCLLSGSLYSDITCSIDASRCLIVRLQFAILQSYPFALARTIQPSFSNSQEYQWCRPCMVFACSGNFRIFRVEFIFFPGRYCYEYRKQITNRFDVEVFLPEFVL